MASGNMVGRRIEAHLLDHGLNADQFGAKVGLSGMTIYRMMYPEIYGYPVRGPHVTTKFAIARELREDPSTLWPPVGRKRRVATCP